MVLTRPVRLEFVRWGDEDVEVLRRDWRIAEGVDTYRKIYAMKPGQRWCEAPTADGQWENLVATPSGPLPVGVVIAQELIGEGADWAVLVELFGGITLLDHDGVCIEPADDMNSLLTEIFESNGGSWSGCADVVGVRGETILFREAKLSRGRDTLRSNQHEFLRRMRRRFGTRVDASVVEWDV